MPKNSSPFVSLNIYGSSFSMEIGDIHVITSSLQTSIFQTNFSLITSKSASEELSGTPWRHSGVKSSLSGHCRWSPAWGRRWAPWCGGKWCWTRHSGRPCSETWTSHGRRCLVSGPPDYKYCSWLKQETMYTKEKLAGFSWLSEMLFQFVPILKFLMKSALFQVLFISLISTWNPSILRNISACGSWDKVEYRENGGCWFMKLTPDLSGSLKS